MDVTPLIPEGRQIIQGYSPGAFKVSGVQYKGAIMVVPTKSWNWNAPQSFSGLSLADFKALEDMAEDIDVVLLGSGGKGEFLPPDLRRKLKDKGLVVDSMETGAACRTYNVLMAEGRRVAAALMPV